MIENAHYSTWVWVLVSRVMNREQTVIPDTLMQADARPCRLRANSSTMKRSPNANTEIKQNINYS
jgi:hypothetical protein